MCIRLTLEDAKKLTHGEVLHDIDGKNADGTPRRWRVTGKVKRWKTRPDEIRVPIARGLYDHSAITHENLGSLRLGPGTSCTGDSCRQMDPIPFPEWLQ